jgi:hypothetical protein
LVLCFPPVLETRALVAFCQIQTTYDKLRWHIKDTL